MSLVLCGWVVGGCGYLLLGSDVDGEDGVTATRVLVHAVTADRPVPHTCNTRALLLNKKNVP